MEPSIGGRAIFTASMLQADWRRLRFYIALAHEFPIIGHFPAHHVSAMQENDTVHILGTVSTLLANALLNEYVPFIILCRRCLISGGIRIEGNLPHSAVYQFIVSGHRGVAG